MSRLTLAIFECPGPDALALLLKRLPAGLGAELVEIGVWSVAGGAELEPVRARFPELPLAIHRLPRGSRYGDVRKAAFERALATGATALLCMRGDASHPPEQLAELAAASARRPGELVIAGRVHEWLRRPPGFPRLRLAAHRIATGLQNRILGLRLSDYHSGFRAVPVPALLRLPFQLCDPGRSFDMQFVIQCRALGVPIYEHPVPPSWAEYSSDLHGIAGVARACAGAIDYRLHQLHLLRRGRWFVDHGAAYTLKRSPSSSHMQILDAIRPGSRVLDLGCSQGLLARPLRERDVSVVGVDRHPPDEVASELAAYYQRDLEAPLELPVGREFDYVILSDVIEHLRNRRELLRALRRFLVAGGRLIVSTPNVALWFYRLSLLLGRFEYGPRGVLDQTHVHLYTRASFRREIQRAGFRILGERVTALPFELVFESTGRSRSMRALDRAYHSLALLWPSFFSYQHILEAELTTPDAEAGRPGAALQR